jgi:glycine cleavage system aminomethyltransferase T
VPPAGALVLADGREVGRVTSAAWSPRLEHGVALGYVHRDSAHPRGHLTIRTETGDAAATIAALAG